MRRAVPALVAVTVLLAGGAASAAVAKPKLPKCLTFADPKGDSGPGAPAATGDPSMDFTTVTLAVVKDTLVAKMTVATLGDNPTMAWGDRFQLNFNYDGKAVEIYYKRSRTRDTEAMVFYQQGIRVGGTFVTDSGISGIYDKATNTMTLATKFTTLKSAAGKGILGGRIEDVNTVVYSSNVAENILWDKADAPDGATFKVATCLQ
jgi:hypothetical protein